MHPLTGGNVCTFARSCRECCARLHMNIIAIDPGPERSAILHWGGDCIPFSAILQNAQLLADLDQNAFPTGSVLAVEMVACYGMPVGREVFETCLWIGRFDHAWASNNLGEQDQLIERTTRLIERAKIKMHHCGTMRAKDSNIRQALIDKYGPPGTKKANGVTYGLKSHLWAAFALATYVSETLSPHHLPPGSDTLTCERSQRGCVAG